MPKYRKKALFTVGRNYLGEIFRELARKKECTVIEVHLMPDQFSHILSIGCHICISWYFAEAWFNKGNSHKHLLDMKGALISFQKVTEWGDQA